jgi:hypothetical protein
MDHRRDRKLSIVFVGFFHVRRFIQTERKDPARTSPEPAAAAQGDACQDQALRRPFERGVLDGLQLAC